MTVPEQSDVSEQRALQESGTLHPARSAKTLFQRIAKWLIVLEIVVSCYFCARQLARPAPPSRIPDEVESSTAEELKGFQHAVTHGGTPEDWRLLGAAYGVVGYFFEAEACCRHAVKLDPTSFDNHFWRAMILDRLGRIPEAIKSLETAAEVTDESTEFCHYLIGREYLRLEQADDAEAAFRRGGGYVMARYELAKLLHRQGKSNESLSILNEVIQDDPREKIFYILRSRVLDHLGQTGAATEDRFRAERSSSVYTPSPVVEFLQREMAMFGAYRTMQQIEGTRRSGNLNVALIRLRRLHQEKWQPSIATNVAFLETQLGNPKEGLRLLKEVFQRDGVTIPRLIHLGAAHILLGDTEEAFAAWERAARIQPNVESFENLAHHYKREGQTAAAKRNAALALQQKGIEAYQHDQLDAAIALLNESLEGLGPNQRSWYFLGESYRATGEWEQARKAFGECLKLEPTHGRAKAALEWIAAERSDESAPSNGGSS